MLVWRAEARQTYPTRVDDHALLGTDRGYAEGPAPRSREVWATAAGGATDQPRLIRCVFRSSSLVAVVPPAPVLVRRLDVERIISGAKMRIDCGGPCALDVYIRYTGGERTVPHGSDAAAGQAARWYGQCQPVKKDVVDVSASRDRVDPGVCACIEGDAGATGARRVDDFRRRICGAVESYSGVRERNCRSRARDATCFKVGIEPDE
jgi:hypothetical protein